MKAVLKLLLWVAIGIVAIAGLFLGVAHAQTSPNFWLLQNNFLHPISNSWGLQLPSLPCTGNKFYQSDNGGSFICTTPSGGASSTNVFGTSGVTVNQVGVNATASLNTAFAASWSALETFLTGATIKGTTTFSSSTNGILVTDSNGVLSATSSVFYLASNPSGYISTSTGLTVLNFSTSSISQWVNDSGFLRNASITATSPVTWSVGNVIACPTCLTANQSITLTGDVTGSGATSIATTYTTSTLYLKFSGVAPISFNTSTGAISFVNPGFVTAASSVTWTAAQTFNAAVTHNNTTTFNSSTVFNVAPVDANGTKFVTSTGGSTTTINGFSGSVFDILAGSGITSTKLNGSTTFTLNLGSGCGGSNFVQTISPTGTITCGIPTGGASSTNVFGINGVTVNQVGVNATASLDTSFAATWTGLQTFNKGLTVNSTATFNSSTIFTNVTSSILATDANGNVVATTTTGGLASYNVTSANGWITVSTTTASAQVTFNPVGNNTSNNFYGFHAGSSTSSGLENSIFGYRGLRGNNGSDNTCIGYVCLFTGIAESNDVAIGAYSGYNATSTGNEFFVNNVLQSNYANDKAFSMLYGNFAGAAATTTGQQLTVNGGFTVSGNATTTGLTITGIASGNCLHTTTSGAVVGTGSDCGAGGGGNTNSTGTVGYMSYFTGTSTLASATGIFYDSVHQTRIGIGTTTPSSPLTVIGAGDFSSGIKHNNHTVFSNAVSNDGLLGNCHGSSDEDIVRVGYGAGAGWTGCENTFIGYSTNNTSNTSSTRMTTLGSFAADAMFGSDSNTGDDTILGAENAANMTIGGFRNTFVGSLIGSSNLRGGDNNIWVGQNIDATASSSISNSLVITTNGGSVSHPASNTLNIAEAITGTGLYTGAVALSLPKTTIGGNATATSLSITGLAGASGCLSVGASGNVTTSTCSGTSGNNSTSTDGFSFQFIASTTAGLFPAQTTSSPPGVVPYAVTLIGWKAVGSFSCTSSIDVWRGTNGVVPTSSASSLFTSSTYPVLNGQSFASSSNTTGWTTTLNPDDVLIANTTSTGGNGGSCNAAEFKIMYKKS